MKKINITTIALLVYLIVMSIIGWPGNNPGNNYTEYFLMIGATLVIIILLRYLQVKRLRMRDKWNKTMILPSNKNTACFSSQKNRLNELYFITLVLILLLFRLHRLLECLIKTTHSINYSIINKYNLNRTHTPLVSLTFLK